MGSQGLCRLHFGPAELPHGERSPQSQEPQPCHLCLVHQMPISSLAIARQGCPSTTLAPTQQLQGLRTQGEAWRDPIRAWSS